MRYPQNTSMLRSLDGIRITLLLLSIIPIRALPFFIATHPPHRYALHIAPSVRLAGPIHLQNNIPTGFLHHDHLSSNMNYPQTSLSMMMGSDMNSIDNSISFLSCVETFDGSGIDPVVVSSAFWAGLKGKIIAVIIGQLLSAVAFAFLSSLVVKQLPKVGDAVVSKLTVDDRNLQGSSDGRAAINGSLSTKPISPDFAKLIICLVIDVIGTSSELVPIVGGVSDIAWAPIAALALRSLYGSNVVFALEFAEEILPFTDIIPLATLCWVVETFYGDQAIAKFLNIGSFGSNSRQAENDGDGGDGVIDVKGDVMETKSQRKGGYFLRGVDEKDDSARRF